MAGDSVGHSFQRILFWKDFVTEKLNTETTDCTEIKEEVEEEQCCIDMSSAWVSTGALAAVQLLTDTLIPRGRQVKKGTGEEVRSTLPVGDLKVEETPVINKATGEEVRNTLRLEDIKVEATPEEPNLEMPFAVGPVNQEHSRRTDPNTDPDGPLSVRVRQTAGSAESAKSRVDGRQRRGLHSPPPDAAPPSDVGTTCGAVEERTFDSRPDTALVPSHMLCDDSPSSKGETDARSDVRVEEQQHFCVKCGKVFRKLVHLKVHMRIHANERRYRCQSCERVFTTYAQWLSHSRVHTGERPYGCSFCEKAFKAKVKLVYHERAHRGERPFRCPDCELAFRSEDVLTRHLRVHRGERPFPCAVCGLALRTQFNLGLHVRTHTGDATGSCKRCDGKPALFTCSVCERPFKSKAKLTYHERTTCMLGVYTPLLELCSNGDSHLIVE